MSHTEAMQSTTPWYREPWPWILMSGPAVVIVAGFTTLYLAASGSDPLVVDNYYKEGLAINQVLARDRAASAANYQAQVLVSTDRTQLRMMLQGTGTLPAQLRLRFVHPTKAGFDRDVLLQQTQPGWYEGRVRLTETLRWEVSLEDLQQHWRLSGSWDPSQSEFALKPRVNSK
jgi:hypothetical protein